MFYLSIILKARAHRKCNSGIVWVKMTTCVHLFTVGNVAPNPKAL